MNLDTTQTTRLNFIYTITYKFQFAFLLFLSSKCYQKFEIKLIQQNNSNRKYRNNSSNIVIIYVQYEKHKKPREVQKT